MTGLLFTADGATFREGPIGGLATAVARHYGHPTECTDTVPCQVSVDVDDDGRGRVTVRNPQGEHVGEFLCTGTTASECVVRLQHWGVRLTFVDSAEERAFARAACEAFGIAPDSATSLVMTWLVARNQ